MPRVEWIAERIAAFGEPVCLAELLQIVIGVILLAVCVGMLVIARPQAGQASAVWLSKPWIVGQAYVLVALITAVVGVSFVLNGWPS